MTRCYRRHITLLVLAVVVVCGGLEASADGPARAMVKGFEVKGAEPQTQGSAQLGDRVTVKIVQEPGTGDEKNKSEKPGAKPGPAGEEKKSSGSKKKSSGSTGEEKKSSGSAGEEKKSSGSTDEDKSEKPIGIPGFTDEEIKKLVPYLNGLPLKGVYPEVI